MKEFFSYLFTKILTIFITSSVLNSKEAAKAKEQEEYFKKLHEKVKLLLPKVQKIASEIATNIFKEVEITHRGYINPELAFASLQWTLKRFKFDF